MGKFTRTLEVFADTVRAGDVIVWERRERVVKRIRCNEETGAYYLHLSGDCTPIMFYWDETVAVLSA